MKQHPIGIAFKHGLAIPFDEFISILGQLKVDATFTMWDNPSELERFADGMAKNRVDYSSIHAPFEQVPSLWEDGLDGEEAEKLYFQVLSDCRRFSVPKMIIHAYMGFDIPYLPNEIGLNRYRRLAAEAERLGVQMVLENTEGEPYFDCLMRDFRDNPNVGFCLDSGHEVCYNRSRDFLVEYGDKLSYLHIDSNEGITSPDGRISPLDDAHLLPYDGTVSMTHLANRLKKCNYEGILMAELNRKGRKGRTCNDAYLAISAEEYLQKAADRLRRLEKEIQEG